MPQDLIALREAAALVGVSPDTVRRWCREGKLKAFKQLGKGLHLYVERAQVEALVKSESVVQAELLPMPKRAAAPKAKAKTKPR